MATLSLYGPIVQDKVYENDVTDVEVKDFISSLDENEELNIHINSAGGHVHVGLAIYQTIKAHKGYTKVFVDGFACSIASIIAFAGDELIMFDSSILMIHLPYVGMVGNRIDFQKEIAVLESMERSLMNVYTSNLRNKSDKDKIRKFLEEEKWFNANELNKYFVITLEEGSEEGQATAQAQILKQMNHKVVAASSNDPAEEFKQKVLKRIRSAKNRQSASERTKVFEAEEKVLDRFKKKRSTSEKNSVITQFRKNGESKKKELALSKLKRS